MTRKATAAGLGITVMVMMATAWSQGTLMPIPIDPVKGAPFTATIESVWEGATEGTSGGGMELVVRYSAGRVRFEPLRSKPDPSVTWPLVTIYDVTTGRVTTLNAYNKVALVGKMDPVRASVTIDPAARKGLPCRVPSDAMSLGVKMIAGIKTCGWRKIETWPIAVGYDLHANDLWFANEYRVPLMQEGYTPGRGKWKQAVVKFQAGEPDPAMFTVPPGYTTKDRPQYVGPIFPKRDGVVPPKVLYAPEPELSDEARRTGVGGTVLMHIEVDPNGLPINVEVLLGRGKALDKRAIKAVKRYRFKPAMKDGHAITVPITFDLSFAADKKNFDRRR